MSRNIEAIPQDAIHKETTKVMKTKYLLMIYNIQATQAKMVEVVSSWACIASSRTDSVSIN